MAAAIVFHQAHGNTRAIVTVAVNLIHQRFRRGATELHGDDGSTTGELSVRRSDLVSALSLVKRAGLGLAFAFPTTR